jgi:UDP-glucose 4-epimerase
MNSTKNKTKKCILVTGGAGYLGCQVIKDLATKFHKYKIVIMDNLSKGRLENIYETINISNADIEILPSEISDIRDMTTVKQNLDKYEPEIIVHLAAIVDAFCTNRPGKDKECIDVNYSAAVNLAKLAKANNVKTFVYISTVSVYSKGDDLDETASKFPVSIYAKAKGSAEEVILSMNSAKFRTCSLRPATIIGYSPGFRYETIINLCCIRAIYDHPVYIFESALTNKKSYVSIKDVSEAIVFTITNIEKIKGQVFNVSSINVNLEEIISIIEIRLKRKMNINIIKEAKINQQVYTICSQKIKDMGFKFRDDNIKKIVAAVLKQLQYNKSKRKWIKN